MEAYAGSVRTEITAVIAAANLSAFTDAAYAVPDRMRNILLRAAPSIIHADFFMWYLKSIMC